VFGPFYRRTTHAKWFLELLSACQSPIEKMFSVALVCDAIESMFTVVGLAASELETPYELEIVPQARVEKFRVDFVVTLRAPEDGFSVAYAVECDGHDFHERTKEQAAADRSRDRRLQELGYIVNRYTGSEIWRDVRTLVGDLTNDAMSRAARAYYAAQAQ
jgi:very-short-patch-repair endonuclease